MTLKKAGPHSRGWRLPLLSRVLVVIHGLLATVVFLWVCFSSGEFNGQQWGLLGWIDFPVFFRVNFCLEALSRYIRVIDKIVVWNPLVYVYTLIAGSIYWCCIGWLLDRLWRWMKSIRS